MEEEIEDDILYEEYLYTRKVKIKQYISDDMPEEEDEHE